MWKCLSVAILLAISAAAQTTPAGPPPTTAGDRPAPPAFPKWALQYFYDEDLTELQITGLAFPSDKRGVAVGVIRDRSGRGKPQYTALVTNDGGAKWSLVPLKEFPRSIFFLNDSIGWIVTEEGIWMTEEAGRSWTRIGDQIKPNKKLESAPDGGLILRVWFSDERHGFAVGMQKTVFHTADGGRTWAPVEEAATPQSNPAFSAYTQIAFADGRRGTIAGNYLPRRPGDGLPDWMVPEQVLSRRQVPTLTLQLVTADAGTTWTASTAPLLGSVGTLRLAGANGMVVFSYGDSFAWPSEVFRIDLTTGKSESSFKQKDREITDALLFADGRAILAAVEPPGNLRSAPVPGKVRMLTSTDFKTWTEMSVDYRAVAGTVMVAGPDPDHLWAATDTGMILKLTAAPATK